MQNGPAREEEGQGYLVSVSDMMSGLLFLFIIALMVFVINFHLEKIKKTEETKALRNIQKELTDAKEVRTELLQDLKDSLEKNGVIVRIDIDKGLLHVPEDILFESGKAEFQLGGERSLAILAANLSQKLPCYAGKRDMRRPPVCEDKTFKPGRLEVVLVEGHTDNVPLQIKGFTNWDLSAKRSIVTYRYLLEVEPELKKLVNGENEPLFGVSGYADTRPVIPHLEIQDEPLNRRIDLRFILSPPKPQVINGMESNL
jgi:chemotaxis protein MotB